MLDLLAPSAFTVFSFGDDGEPELKRLINDMAFCTYRRLSRPTRELQAILGEATAAVVRPDGYLLCTGNNAAMLAQLSGWFDRWRIATSV